MDRLALVIGNSNYLHTSKLFNPKNDACDMENVLKKLSFDVTKILDADLFGIQCAINKFLQMLDEYAVGLLFYAGHGMQIDGKNYIVPIDLNSHEKAKTIVSCYCMNSFMDGVAVYKGKTVICILDACRNNPFADSRGLASGFSPFSNPPKGIIIAYSTSADSGAFDGRGSNGLYTQVLKDAMLIPNLKIEEMFKSVRNSVAELSVAQYGEEQLSWEYSSLVGDFYFSVEQQPVNIQVDDEEIYNYINERGKYYESISNNINDIECMPYIDAYKKYSVPLIKILRAYSRIQYVKMGYQFSDATIDQLNYSYISSWGFRQEYGRWFYKDYYVEMGDFLPLPPELEPMKPIEDKKIEIKASMTAEVLAGKIRFSLKSNIPETTPLIFSLKGNKFLAQSKIEAGKDITISDWFSDKGNMIKKGFYTIDVTCPIDKVLPCNIQELFGERNRNICGTLVKFDPINGNTINALFGVLVNDKDVQLLDMQKRISEL